MKRAGPVILLLACAAESAAQELPVVRVELAPAEVAVGESVELQVTVLGPTWFPEPPVFPSFEIANAVVRMPRNRSRPISERIGRETWYGVVRNYEIFPLTSARYRLDGLAMRVTYADPADRRAVAVDVDVPPVEFRAVIPAGAESVEPYLAGRALSVTRDLEGDPESLTAGDALVARYTAELDGMPAIFLPPLVAPTDTPGLSVYADEPEIEDGTTARRSEKLTYVFAMGGDFEIPAVSLRWWNTETSSIESSTIAPLTVHVAGPRTQASAAGNREDGRRWLHATGGALLLLLVFGIVVRAASYLRPRWRAYRDERLASEAYAFGQLRKALRTGNPRRAYAALFRWLERLGPGTDLERFSGASGDAALRDQLERLSRACYADSRDSPDLRHLDRLLVAARRRRERAQADRTATALPSLNP